MSLTATAEKLRENYGLVQILTALFHDMGMNVVAEGAEYADQVELLMSYGVDGIQGYHFAKPMPLDKLAKFLKKENYPEERRQSPRDRGGNSMAV
jgi:EAL domain-containing protein (putative c-di-GMP-specific phosphodiesterase class I)